MASWGGTSTVGHIFGLDNGINIKWQAIMQYVN
jgi:hypothetical protein